MKNVDLAGAVERLRKAGRVVIVSHLDPDGDAIGSTLALANLARALGVGEVQCLNNDPVPSLYQWVAGANHIVGPESAWNSGCDLAVVVDTSAWDRLGAAEDAVRQASEVLVLDHHLVDEPLGDYCLVDPLYAASGELVMELYDAAGVAIDRERAESLYVAIATDTGGFRFSNTTARAHRLAARLLETGLDVAAISERVFDGISPTKFELLRRALGRAQFAADGAVVHSAILQEDIEAAQAGPDEVDGLIKYLRNVDSVQVAMMFRELDETTTKVSMRSRNGFNSAVFLQQFGGGGHALAAGATLELPLEQARDVVLDRVTPIVGETS
ncbi:MAG: DHH family phosphoesterase [Candidatus Hydrogenedentota bacterium]